MNVNVDLSKAGALLTQGLGELRVMQQAFRERGTNRFARAVVLGVLSAFGSYYLVYAPPAKKSAQMARKIEAARLTAEHADSYKAQRDRLRAVFVRLPKPQEAEGWLQDQLVTTLKAENITPDSIAPPEKLEKEGLVSQTMDVQMTVRFGDLVNWLNRVEQSTPTVHVASLQIDKTEFLGINQVRALTGTVIPKVESLR